MTVTDPVILLAGEDIVCPRARVRGDPCDPGGGVRRPYVCYEFKGMINIKYPRDIAGMKFGELTVLRKADERTSNGETRWICRCSCGNEAIVKKSHLTSGGTKSCGCMKEKKRTEDLTGRVFGRLTVVERVEDSVAPSGRKNVMWKCRCECGNEIVARGSHLRNGSTKSCGCLNRELVSTLNKKHGFSGERLYRVWEGIIKRCCNKNDKSYHNYGGRGIKICDEWRFDYIAFREWALANGYDESAPKGECTIDRIDVNGDYKPDNCRFVSMYEQSQNKRNTLRFAYNGEDKTLKEWCKEYDLSYKTVRYRLKHGWTFEEALEL